MKVPKKLKLEIAEATKEYLRHVEDCVQCSLAFHPSDLCSNVDGGYSLWLNAKNMYQDLNGNYDDPFNQIHLKLSKNI